MDMCRVANSLRHILASSYKGGWGQRDIFFQFFCTQKTQKNSTYIQPTQAVSWVAACRNGCPKSSEILGPQTSGFEVSKIVLFVRFAEKSAKVRKVANPDKSWQILKNPKNPEKSQNRQKVDFWPKVEILAGLAGLARTIRLRLRSSHLAKSRDFGRFGRSVRTAVGSQKNRLFSGPEKSEKFRKFRLFWPPKKIEKKCCIPWRSMIAPRGIQHKSEAKKTHFFEDFRG